MSPWDLIVECIEPGFVDKDVTHNVTMYSLNVL